MKERQKEPSQQKNPRKWGMILLMAVLIIVMLVSLWNILGYLLEGRKSEKFAQDLQESAIIIEKDNTDSKDTKKEKEEKEEPIPDAIDFDTLHAISKDAVAWLYAPGGGINYVVAQAGDNDYYLHRLLNGTEAKAGYLIYGLSESFRFFGLEYDNLWTSHEKRYNVCFAGKISGSGIL